MTNRRRALNSTVALATVLLWTSSALAATKQPPICEAHGPRLAGDVAAARNIKATQAIYAAFVAGAVQSIVDCVAEDAQWERWEDNYAQEAGVPWLKAQMGPVGAAAFFKYIGAWKVNAFAVKNIMGAGASVAAEVEVDFDVTQTGGHIRDQEIQYWTFNDRGQITGLRHYSDTAKHIAAAKNTHN